LPKGLDPHDVTEELAIELIIEKRKKDAEKLIKGFDEDPTVKVLNGRFGPYIEFGKLNVKIPKGKEPQSLTFEECKELAAAAEKEPKKAGKKFVKKK
jgi:DNA topoisomerase-1